MNNTLSIPAQVFSVTDTNGNIIPIHVRFRNTQDEIETYNKIEILKPNMKQMHASYLCSTVQYNSVLKFVLCYNYARHTWTIEFRNTAEEYNYILNN